MEIILLMDNETDYNISEDFFIFLAESALKNKKINYPLETAEISLVLTDDNEMQEINKLYRKIDKTTDVLSFPINEGKNISSKMLGDIVISIDRMKSQAIENGCTEEEELATLFIHGLLHLLGYDHEKGEEEEKDMFDLQDEIVGESFK